MKLDLPDDHPIAQAIRGATFSTGHCVLSLDHFSSEAGWKRLLSLEIDAWTLTRRAETRCTLELVDSAERQREIEALKIWPEMPDNG